MSTTKHTQDEHDVRKAAIEDGMNERAEEWATRHTATPWEVLPLGGFGTIDIRDASGPIALTGTRNREIEENEANAAFIVRAVNSHAELLTALKALVDCYTPTTKVGIDAVNQARAAIARAEGRVA